MAFSGSTTVGTAVNTTTTTLPDLLSDVEDSNEWIKSTAPRVVFLAVFISFGFFGNVFLIMTVCQSHRLRSVAFFMFLMNLAVINVCECSLNMSILLASSIINEWKFGVMACRVSSFFLNLICIETLLGLTITTADRMVAVRFKDRYTHVISTPRIAILITVTWVQSFAFSVPIAVGIVPTSVNSYTVYCVISKGSSLVYNIFNAIVCFIVPLVLMIVFFVKIMRTVYMERLIIRSILSQHNYNDDSGEEPRVKQDIRHVNLTGTICMAWLMLTGPHVVTSYFNQIQNSAEIGGNNNEDLEYVWYVDLVLLWLRFSYAMALPIASFTWSKDLWKSFKDMILCRKNNAIVDESMKRSDSDTIRLDRKIKEERLKEKEAIISVKDQRVFQVPVLFATSHGVLIQTSSQNEKTDDEHEENETSNATIIGTLRGKTCDVIGSQDNLNNNEDDTSDYDSGNEMDPFSASHPISVKQINKDNDLIEIKRSLSESEVRDKIQSLDKLDRSNGRTVGSTSEADSGLDLSTSTYTKSSKNISTFHVPSDKLILHSTHDQLQTEIMENVCVTQSNKAENIHDNIASNADTEIPSVVAARNDYMDSNEDSTNDNVQNKENKIDSEKLSTPSSKNVVCQKASAGVGDSPLPRRKKKKRKENKNFDTQSITSVTSNTGIPPRPPPRLAPIAAVNNFGLNALYSGSVRPGSSCSSQYSMADSNMDGRQSVLSCVDVTRTDAMPCDNLSITSFNIRKNKKGGKVNEKLLQETYSNNLLNENDFLQLECKREIKSVPEEILSPGGSTIEDTQKLYPETGFQLTHTGIFNTGYLTHCSDGDVTDVTNVMQTQSRVINTEARRKRREKLMSTRDILSTATLLNDGKGYQRLVPDTPGAPDTP